MEARNPADILRALLAFDTTNPPGNETACIRWVDRLLRGAGLETVLAGDNPERLNLVTRLQGRGEGPALLVHGHVDVVSTEGQPWSVPPFDAVLRDGVLWGRGALDMKGSVAMILAAVLRMQQAGARPPGDVVVAIVADEEAGSDHGAGFLVNEHPHLFGGVRYAIGEGGGQSVEVGGRRLYQIAIAEKRVCWMRVRLTGNGGHGSSPVFGGAMSRLRALLEALDSRWLPVHITEATRQQVTAMAAAAGGPLSKQLLALLDPRRTDATLAELGPLARRLGPLLHHTVSVTRIHASDKVNVIPSEITVELDGRLLPGHLAPDLVAEVEERLEGVPHELEVVRTEPPGNGASPDLTGYEVLAGLLRELDPEGTPVPSVTAGFTDGCQFSKLGIQNYGCLPARFPADFQGDGLVHAADERIPVSALDFGAEGLYRILTRFASAIPR
ncbi:MAG: M20/M25/M40 family metallo-hydrolase [Candidatus Dormibacteraeota bacterium]|nr:M20/M25/M40 family metallo-hydrolase [Candidatus Dormibacteraeota bacterium]MBO0743889.1 M20/M25/M40 family metallo-hydrolase [Candidatus Dormibacteraeota bacterium]